MLLAQILTVKRVVPRRMWGSKKSIHCFTGSSFTTFAHLGPSASRNDVFTLSSKPGAPPVDLVYLLRKTWTPAEKLYLYCKCVNFTFNHSSWFNRWLGLGTLGGVGLVPQAGKDFYQTQIKIAAVLFGMEIAKKLSLWKVGAVPTNNMWFNRNVKYTESGDCMMTTEELHILLFMHF